MSVILSIGGIANSLFVGSRIGALSIWMKGEGLGSLYSGVGLFKARGGLVKGS